jgi:hypothetical protein
MSSEDIEKGAVGLAEISTQLMDCSFGIICLTQENQGRAWINFEAGALSKSVGDDPSRVATLLVDIRKPTDVSGPLAQFQATNLTLADMTRLCLALDKASGTDRQQDRVEKVVAQLWPSFESKLRDALEALESTPVSPEEPRGEREMLEELLTTVREMARRQSSRNHGPRDAPSLETTDPSTGRSVRVLHEKPSGPLKTLETLLLRDIRKAAPEVESYSITWVGARPTIHLHDDVEPETAERLTGALGQFWEDFGLHVDEN